MAKTFLLVLLLLPAILFGQVNITGKVISQTDTKPVANASVFLSNATIGSKTADDGTFTLKNVKPGKYDLVISILGFDTYNQTITVDNSDIHLPPAIIFPKAITLGAVTIKAGINDFERNRNYDLFKTQFLGTTALAKECKIINPEMLDLSYDEKTGILKASSADFLVIENHALGYKIKYLLKDFRFSNGDDKTFSYSGFILFESLKGTTAEEQEWQKKRQEVYEGSQAHFLTSAINNQLEEAGFYVQLLPFNPDRPADSIINEKIRIAGKLKNNPAYKDSLNYWTKKLKLSKTLGKLNPTLLTRKELITGPDKYGLYTLNCSNGELFITYNKYHHFNGSSLIKLADPENTDKTLVTFNDPKVVFDENGTVINPQALTYVGGWIRGRLAGLLPVDYGPQQSPGAEATISLIKNLSGKLSSYTARHSTEKAYLQFDKPYYTTGDTIYFKAYLTKGERHEPSELSGILHVDLINPENKINRSLQLQVIAGTAWGDFTLPDTLKGGNYRVRAYTNWMRNDGEGSFFEQNIPIGTTEVKKIAESGEFNHRKSNTKVTVNKTDIQFMPEGGNLITGNYSKIAFKAISPDGLGTDIRGTVTDDAGTSVCTFASSHLGMGVFNFVPEDGKNYKAQVTYADGTTNTIDLPKSQKNGYTININNTDRDSIRLRVTAGNGSSTDKLNLVAQSGGTIYYVAENQSGNKFFSAVIPKSKFPTGIVQFTLFSAAGEPLNERLAFINNNDQLKLNVTAKESYAARQKVEIWLNAKSKNDMPITTGSFSVSVTDETKVPVNEAGENTILSNLLLTSELKGTVEQPNYYFANADEKTNADLDLLMLTQGYRHFGWKKILSNDSVPAAYQPQKALEISGTVKTGGGKPIAGAKVTLFTKSGGPFLIDTLTDTNGKFIFSNLTFGDSVKFIVQAKVAKGQNNVVLNLDSAAAPAIMKVKNTTALNLLADTSAYLANQRLFYHEQQKYGINKHAVLLKEVIVKDRKIEPVPHSENLNGSGNADQVLTAKDLEKMNCGSLTDCLSGVLTGVIFRSKYVIPDGGLPLNQRMNQAIMAVVIDGVVLDPNDARDELNYHLHAEDIEGIEVILGPHYGAIYGSRMANGGLIITTKRARRTDNYERYAPGVVTYMPKGFYKAREFYSPLYDNPKTNKQMPDLRSTIFWKPDLITDKDGKTSFEYFNADSKGTYRIVIEGIDADGNLGRQVYRYKVE